ncbi:hypothetical protein COT62_00570 [Candidatus Roizmanbacteria bacterium CG09_land_8_20_14_0_10_41_9]|uniref:Uncharacterized protein n=1 Tax=Candidatus Roizmanbacteria bacterium CG09_land_8_20_14_0_10_41_9 TaxID=1974850 RepID=A0A2H0WTU9_9BACT|nr:MAG: hypothetical protein COT62_00570 [Candidatus Roizmanbacteria bacterium CG09_land_8_20_14_0_10_41_9]
MASIVETLLFPFTRASRADSQEVRVPELPPAIMEQVDWYVAADYPEKILLSEGGKLTKDEYIWDMAHVLQRLMKGVKEEDLERDRVLVIDPRVALDVALGSFEVPCPELNLNCVEDFHEGPEKQSYPYLFILRDLPWFIKPTDRSNLIGIAQGFPGFYPEGLTAREAAIYIKLHPELGEQHISNYFVGSRYGKCHFVMQTTNHHDQAELMRASAADVVQYGRVPLGIRVYDKPNHFPFQKTH